MLLGSGLTGCVDWRTARLQERREEYRGNSPRRVWESTVKNTLTNSHDTTTKRGILGMRYAQMDGGGGVFSFWSSSNLIRVTFLKIGLLFSRKLFWHLLKNKTVHLKTWHWPLNDITDTEIHPIILCWVFFYWIGPFNTAFFFQGHSVSSNTMLTNYIKCTIANFFFY